MTRPARLVLETLENRLTPATVVWTDAGGDGLWTNPANWFNISTHTAALPIDADDVVFNTGQAGVPGGGSSADVTLSRSASVGSLTVGPGYAGTSNGTGHVTLNAGLDVSAFTLNSATATVQLRGDSGSSYRFSGLTVAAGTLDAGSGSFALNAGGAGVNLTGGTLVSPAGLFNVYGNWARTPGVVFHSNGGTVAFGGISQTLDSGGTDGPFARMTINGTTLIGRFTDIFPTQVQLVGHPLAVTGNLTLDDSELETSGQDFTVGGTLTVLGEFEPAAIHGPMGLVIGSTVTATKVSERRGALLSGTGTVNAPVEVADHSQLAPDAGGLTGGATTFDSTASYDVNLGTQLPAAGFSYYISTGAVDLGGASLSVASLGFTPAVGTQFTILKAAGGVTGTFHGLPDGATLSVPGLTRFDTQLRIHYTANAVTLTVGGPAVRLTAVAADAGGGPRVKVFNADSSVRFDFFAYDPTFTGGVRVAVADLTGDGTDDIITAAGPGGGPHVEVFDGVSGKPIASFFAYDPTFTDGVFVAAGDVTGGGEPNIVTGAGAGGGPHVKVFDGRTLAQLRSFYAYDPAFTGGVTVAADSGRIVTGAGPGGGPHVKVFDGNSLALVASFFAYDAAFTGGVYVAAAGGKIFTGPGAGGGPDVKEFDLATGTEQASYYAYAPFGDPTNVWTGGVRVAEATDDAGQLVIVTGTGPGGAPHVRLWDATTLNVTQSFFAFEAAFTGGVFVG